MGRVDEFRLWHSALPTQTVYEKAYQELGHEIGLAINLRFDDRSKMEHDQSGLSVTGAESTVVVHKGVYAVPTNSVADVIKDARASVRRVSPAAIWDPEMIQNVIKDDPSLFFFIKHRHIIVKRNTNY